MTSPARKCIKIFQLLVIILIMGVTISLVIINERNVRLLIAAGNLILLICLLESLLNTSGCVNSFWCQWKCCFKKPKKTVELSWSYSISHEEVEDVYEDYRQFSKYQDYPEYPEYTEEKEEKE